MEETSEYESFSALKEKVMTDMELVDHDIYKICENWVDDKK